MIKVTTNDMNSSYPRTAEVNEGITLAQFVNVQMRLPTGSFQVLVNGVPTEVDEHTTLKDGDVVSAVIANAKGAKKAPRKTTKRTARRTRKS